MGRRRRGLLGFYIGTGLALLLLVSGWLTRGYLMLQYAMHRARKSQPTSSNAKPADRWLQYCMDRARQGDPTAIRFLVDISGRKLPYQQQVGTMSDALCYDVTTQIAFEQTKLFLAELDRRSDSEALRVLWAVTDSIYVWYPEPYSRHESQTATELIAALEIHANAIRSKPCVATPKLLDYARRRFDRGSKVKR